jgi:alpha,alpha-trehalose phosphorylase
MADILHTTVLDPERLALEETLYHCANGYLGVRGCFEEGYPEGIPSVRGTYINAFYDTHPIHHPEKLYGFPETGERILNVTDAQTIFLEVEGERVLLEDGRFSRYERGLDADGGIARRSFEWRTAGGAGIAVSIRRLASLARRELFAVEYSVTCLDRGLDMALIARLEGEVENFFDANDPRLSGKAFKGLAVAKTGAEAAERGGELRILSRTLERGAELATVSLVEIEEGPPARVAAAKDATSASLVLSFRLGPGETLRLARKNVYADSDRSASAEATAREATERLRGLSFAAIAAEQERELAGRWAAADISVAGDESVSEALRFDLFELMQSAPADERSSVPAKGLSGEGYEGHYFWDAEIYMAPFYLYTDPAAARRMLLYRHSTLTGARTHARAMSQARGAVFPWRTIAGRECSAYYPSGSAQYHINADIAYAAWKYYEATSDLPFLRDAGAELLFETARAWVEIGHFSEGEFRIDAVTGPDEYACIVDNSYYTNAMARFNLRAALKARAALAADLPDALADIDRRIGLWPSEPGSWEEAAERMYLPYDAARDIAAQDDGFLRRAEWDFEGTPDSDYPLLLTRHHLCLRRHQVCKQADVVLAHFLLPGIAAESTVRNSYAYYEKRTTHDSSLSYAVFAAMAARLGDTEKALEYFSRTARLDLDDVQGNSRDGIHAANLGGTWLALAMGFGGLSAEEGLLSLGPVLPESWKGLSFTAAFRGSTLRIRATRAAGGRVDTLVELLRGPGLHLSLYGERRFLEGSLRATSSGP